VVHGRWHLAVIVNLSLETAETELGFSERAACIFRFVRVRRHHARKGWTGRTRKMRQKSLIAES